MNNPVRRTVVVAIIVVLIAAAVLTYGIYYYTHPPVEKKKLTWLYHSYTPWLEVLPELADGFMEEHPDVEIEIVVLGPAEYYMKLWSAVEIGEPYDIFGFKEEYLYDLVKGGHLDPAPDWVVEDIHETKLPSVYEYSFYKEQIWGYVQHLSVLTYVVNPVTYESMGLDYPTTWDELLTINEQMKTYVGGALNKSGINLALGTPTWVVNNYRVLCLGEGIDLFDQGLTKTLINTPAGIRAAEMYKELATPVLPESTTSFMMNVTATDYKGPWFKPYVPWVKALPPLEGKDGNPVTGAYVWYWGVSSRCEYKEEAWQFTKYLSEPEQYKKLVESCSFMPINKVNEEIWKEQDPEWMGVFMEAAKVARWPWYQMPNYQRIQTVIFEMIHSIVLEEKTPEEAVADAAETINLLMS